MVNPLPFSLLLTLLCTTLNSSIIAVDLDFVVPGSNELISTKLSIQSRNGITFQNAVRSVLHINTIIMDCTFNFDGNNPNKALICDVNNACISSTHQSLSPKLHLENLGIADLGIIQIKKDGKILFYDNMVCIGDSHKCDGRYIDFVQDPATQNLKISITTQRPNILQCNPKNIIYSAPTKAHKDAIGTRNSASKRKLLVIHDDIYGDYNYYKKVQVVQHSHYMDIILTFVFLILIVVSVFNLSYAFITVKGTKSRRQYFDTRRV